MRKFIFTMVLGSVQPALLSGKEAQDVVVQQPKTLASNGYDADSYAEFSFQSVTIAEEDTTLAALRLGFQFVRFPYIGLAVGYGANGLGDLYYRSDDPKAFSVLYHGPTAELFIAPELAFSGSFSALFSRGNFEYQEEKNTPKAEVAFRANEFGFNLFYRFASLFQIVAGAGMHSLSVENRTNYADGDDEESSLYFIVGARASKI